MFWPTVFELSLAMFEPAVLSNEMIGEPNGS